MYTALQHYMYLIVYCIFIQHTNTCTCTCSVSPRIRWGSTSVVHDVWSTMFNSCHKTVCFSINFKIKGCGSKAKGWGSAMVPSFGGNTVYTYMHMTVQCTCKHNIEYSVSF